MAAPRVPVRAPDAVPVRVPFVDLPRLVRRFSARVEGDWAEVLERCEFVGGPTVARLEARLAEQLGLPHVVGCASGTSALIIALQALGVRAGAKVALPNLTFWATYEAIAQLGATPVLVDVDPDDLQLSLGELRRAHDRERFGFAVLPHLFGWTSARLRELRALCDERAIALIEDGAQCFGVEAGGAPVLSGARVATLSFYPAKVVGGALDGGAILCRDRADAERARLLCNHGRVSHYSYAHVGWNSRMGGLQASFVLRALEELPFILDTRRRALEQYAAFARAHAIKLHGPPEGVVGNGYLAVFAARGGDGARLAAELSRRGIGVARTYPETLDAQPPARDAVRVGDLAHGRAFCRAESCATNT